MNMVVIFFSGNAVFHRPVARDAFAAGAIDGPQNGLATRTDQVFGERLAVKLHEKYSDKFGADVTLSAEEIAKIKDKIGKVSPPLVVRAAWMILNPASVP